LKTRPPRILVLRGGAIGDFIVTLPALRALRERWPDAYIELVAYLRIAPLALCGGVVDKVTSLDQAQVARFYGQNPAFPEEQVRYIRSFDFVLLYLHDPDELVRTNLQLAGARQVLYGSPKVEGSHAVDHLVRPLEALAIYARGAEPVLDVPEDWRRKGVELIRAAGVAERPVVLHPGSGSERKNWRVDGFIEVAHGLGLEEALFTAGEADDGVVPLVSAAGFRIAPTSSLQELAAVLSCARAFVGNDSGVTHLAAAMGVPTLGIFGPTRKTEWGPRGRRVRILEAPEGDLAQLEASVVAAAVVDILSD